MNENGMRRYRIAGPFGHTVFHYDDLTDAMEKLWNMKTSNGGIYKIVDRWGREYARIDTYATYWPLCHELNEPLQDGKRKYRG